MGTREQTHRFLFSCCISAPRLPLDMQKLLGPGGRNTIYCPFMSRYRRVFILSLVTVVAGVNGCGGGNSSSSSTTTTTTTTTSTPPPLYQQVFVQTSGNLTVPRGSHAAVLLNNGKVLLTGGTNSTGLLNSAELFDPAIQSFMPVGSMAVVRVNHTMTLLGNGQVLVVGANSSSGVELFDPAAAAFVLTGRLSNARREHTATLLQNGKVLIAGGFSEDINANPQTSLATCELYDPSGGTFALTGSLGSARQDHSAAMLQNGKVLITGGHFTSFPSGGGGTAGPAISAAEIYDPANGSFAAAGAMIVARFWHSSTTLKDGRILIAGGEDVGSPITIFNSAEIYDPSKNTFTAVGSMSTPRAFHTASLLSDGTVLIAGGISGLTPLPTGGFVGVFTSSAEIFDPSSNTFKAIPNMTISRAQQTATVLANGQVLVAGGGTSGGATAASAEIFK